MNEVKVWCEVCNGMGGVNGTDLNIVPCPRCKGKGYNTHSFWELAHDYKITLDPQPYSITDAQADAAVLTAITDYAAVNEIKKAILARLHAFYCGGQDDKR